MIRICSYENVISYPVWSLIEIFESGYYRIPFSGEIKVNLEWENKKKEELLKSILLGVPVGLILLSCAVGNVAYESSICELSVKNTQRPTYFVLDGVQRIKVLYEIFSNKNVERENTFYYDPELKVFTYQKCDDKTIPKHYFPMHEIFNESYVSLYRKEKPQPYGNRVIAFKNYLTSYKIFVLRTYFKNLEEIREHINRIV